MTRRNVTTLVDGWAFFEAPRWRDDGTDGGGLYLSAMYQHAVLRVDLDGRTEVVTTLDGIPSGLGWWPDGTLMVVSMEDRRLLAVGPDGTPAEVADLSGLAPAQINDLVVASTSRAYVTQLGSDLIRGAPLVPAPILRVDPDGSVHQASPHRLRNPNGVLLTPDDRTLVVAEHRGGRLTAFDVLDDGSLDRPRTWAALPADPDGICLDADGAVWCALPAADRFVRVADGGEVLEEVRTDGRHAIAPALGGPDGRVLFMLTAETVGREAHLREKAARVEVCRVDVPGVGRP